MKAWIVYKKAIPQSIEAITSALSSDKIESIDLVTSRFYLDEDHAKERQIAMIQLIKDLGFDPFYTAGISQIDIIER
jgi:hypothetical protein